MAIKLNAVSPRVKIRMFSAIDGIQGVTGLSGSNCTLSLTRSSDGTSSDFASGAFTLTEVTSGAFANNGFYWLTLPAFGTAAVGETAGVIRTNAGAARDADFSVEIVANLVSDVIAALGTPVASVSADLAAVKAELDTVNASVGSGLGTNVTAIKAKTDNLPSDPASQATTASEITSATSPLAASSALSTLQTSATAIKAKTDNLPTDPADESLLEAAITAATNTLAADIASATVDLTPVLDVLGTPIHGSIALDIANVSGGGGSGHTLIAGRTLVIYSVLDEDRRVPALVEAIGPNNILALFVFDPVVGNYHLRKVPFSTGHEENTWDWNDTV